MPKYVVEKLALHVSPIELQKTLTETMQGCRLSLHVHPGSKKNEIVGMHGDALKIKITAPPEDGKANEAVIRFLAEVLDLPRARISIIRGQTSRKKVVEIRKS